jgi:protein TonB
MAPADRHTLGIDAGAAIVAVVLTLALFLLLPYVHVVAPSSLPVATLIDIPVVKMPPLPPSLPPPEPAHVTPEPIDIPQPVLDPPTVKAVPLDPVLEFDVALDGIGGDFGLAFSVDAAVDVAGAGGAFELSDVDSLPQAVVQMRPFYPSNARRRRLEGEVTILFTVNSVGDTEDVRVIDSVPEAVFDEAAIRAVKRWRFTPAIKDERPVAVRVRQLIRFRMED